MYDYDFYSQLLIRHWEGELADDHSDNAKVRELAEMVISFFSSVEADKVTRSPRDYARKITAHLKELLRSDPAARDLVDNRVDSRAENISGGAPVAKKEPPKKGSLSFHGRLATKKPPGPRDPGDQSIDVGILVALPEEFRQLHPRLSSPDVIEDKDTGLHDYIFLHGSPDAASYRCAATLIGDMGPDKAALAAERFIIRRRPKSIVMLGIAAGVDDDVKLGDVVVGTHVAKYLDRSKAVEGEGETFDIQPGGESYPCSEHLIQAARNLEFAHDKIYRDWIRRGREDRKKTIPRENALKLRGKNWLRERPRFEYGPIASGPVVAASGNFLAWLKKVNRNYLALEMESGGVLAAIYGRSDPRRSLVLRGISDFGDKRKKMFDKIGKGGIRAYAMKNAIRLLWSFLDAKIL